MTSPEQGFQPEQISPQEKLKLTTELGALLHNEWRAPRLKEDESYEPRFKVLIQTKEGKKKWYNEGEPNIPAGAEELQRQDIANTDFENLVPYFQEDNKMAAEAAMGEVFKAVENSIDLNDSSFIESASSVIHDDWLKRNGYRATETQKKPYQELPEDEKEQDRTQLRKAIDIYKKSKT